RPRRFQRVALAAILFGDTPANLKAGPARRTPRPHPPDIFAARFFLDGEHAETMQRPMPRHHGGVAPAAQLARDRLAVSSGEKGGTGVLQHALTLRDIIAALLSLAQARVCNHRPIDPHQSGAWLERRDHRLPSPFL